MKDAVNITASREASSHGSTILKEILALDNKISDAVRTVYIITICNIQELHGKVVTWLGSVDVTRHGGRLPGLPQPSEDSFYK
jgi:hypothetical protein